MPRQARESSGTGIYHVMMRGINHQNIFEEQEDYYQFLTTLDVMAQSYESDGTPVGRNYILYAYCLMSNHIHLLIREREDTIGMAIKRIASSYVYYYNHKYSRDGHLFRERFKSEPVNDIAYFVTLLRYIHQNPLKAGMVERVKDYEFSSWGEYIDKDSTLFPLCDTRTVLSRIPFNDLDELVNDPLSDDIVCLDIGNVRIAGTPGNHCNPSLILIVVLIGIRTRIGLVAVNRIAVVDDSFCRST